ncbi:hypothetical protein [Saccharothrix syringae]|uniref:Uncharacterized protein n=1 Tax=Saccharothrix syringae TaxID=103733 RepID=A0A5Q0GXU0_SACSY|nr:hypothetical protein [Saccharothrix syringae]QFZ18182.1 hypothetical protein EKG83_12430 [Saccharothrix syringae]
MTVLGPLLQVLAFLSVPAGFAWFATRARRSGSGHSLMAPFEEIWDPGAHRTHLEVQVREDRRAPTPSPGDPPARA